VLSVRVDPRANEGWWYEGGGINRHTRLVVSDCLHTVPLGGVFVSGDVTGKVVRTDSAHVTADATVTMVTELEYSGDRCGANAARNAGGNGNGADTAGALVDPTATVTAAVRSTIYDAKGATVWSGTSDTVVVSSGSATTVTQHAVVGDAALWEARQQLVTVDSKPALYVLVTEVLQQALHAAGDSGDRGGDVGHKLPFTSLPESSRNTTFGIRKVVFDPNDGLLLNDRKFRINGSANHHDFAAVGTALPDRCAPPLHWLPTQTSSDAWVVTATHSPPSFATTALDLQVIHV
jgi:beta-galactosidase